jgi:hypothetical protein
MAAFCSISIALTLENGIALVEQTASHNRNIMRIWLSIGDVPISALQGQTVSRKKERSGLQSACDESIDKGAIITGE